MDSMCKEGYCAKCAKEVVAFLLRNEGNFDTEDEQRVPESGDDAEEKD